VLKSYRVISKVLRRGLLGFAESYIAGDVATDNLLGLFDFFLENEQALGTALPQLSRSGWRDRLFHRRRANSRAGSRRNIADHYDLGNAFYRLWLDAGLTYSSGIYTSSCASLEAAQEEKYHRILAALDLSRTHSVLEIGCGWGGFAVAAAARAASVRGITISRQQFEEATARVARAGLEGRAHIHLEDYRDTTGSFDRIASIEMIEAVGAENWPIYFQTIADRLKPGGKAVLQAITIKDDLFEGYRANPDFIQRYVFPGGMLPTVKAMRRHAQDSRLEFETLQKFGASYALTLAEWHRRFEEAWPRIAVLGFDERFRRMWDYYLSYCRTGFERGTVDVGLYRLAKRP
jgi:cyclopropane-fatty-acyl-phospholipid synthase